MMRPYGVSLLAIPPGRLIKHANRFAFSDLRVRTPIFESPRCRYFMFWMFRFVRAGERRAPRMAQRYGNGATIGGDMLHFPFRASLLFREVNGQALMRLFLVRRPMLR